MGAYYSLLAEIQQKEGNHHFRFSCQPTAPQSPIAKGANVASHIPHSPLASRRAVSMMIRLSALQHSCLLLVGVALILASNAGAGRSLGCADAFVPLHPRRILQAADLRARSFPLAAKQSPSQSDEIQAEIASPPAEQLSEAERLQMELNAAGLGDETPWLSFTPNNFDSKQLPIPLFTSIVVLLFSLYTTFYGFYVGIYGFSAADDKGLPRIF